MEMEFPLTHTTRIAIAGLGHVGKLPGRGIEFHEQWHFELGCHFETNYVLVRRDSRIRQFGCVARFDEPNGAVRL